MLTFHSFADVWCLNDTLCRELVTQLSEAVLLRDTAYLVVSGGKTPKKLYEQLAQTNLPWANVVCSLTDERWVDPNHHASNEQLVRTSLLQHQAAAATFIGLYQADDEVEEARQVSDRQIGSLPTFDVVILGMGEDGHTASLFPNNLQTAAALNDLIHPVAFVEPTLAPHRRITMTKARLLDSRLIYLLLVGEEKLAIYHRALAGTDVLEMPIRAFLHEWEVAIRVMYAPQ